MGAVAMLDLEPSEVSFSAGVDVKEAEESASDDARVIAVDTSLITLLKDEAIEAMVCEGSPVPAPDSPSEVTIEEPLDWLENSVDRVAVSSVEVR
jgi:hypothetical protein